MAEIARLALPDSHAEPPDPASGSVYFIGTATTLIRYAGFTILTDPNFLHAGDHVHLGGTRVLGIMVTMDGRQGVEAIRIIRPKKAIPIHFNDYPVFKSPLEDFRKAVDKAGLSDKVVYLRQGETYNFKVPVPVREFH